MLKYLLEYGIKNDVDLHNELDFHSLMEIQEQLNEARTKYAKILDTYDEIQGEIAATNSAKKAREKELLAEGIKGNDRYNDDQWVELDLKWEALGMGLKSVENQIYFITSDIRILNNMLYKVKGDVL